MWAEPQVDPVGGTLTSLGPDETRIPVDAYRSPERLAAEQRVLFRKRPILLAHASEVAAPGDCRF